MDGIHTGARIGAESRMVAFLMGRVGEGCISDQRGMGREEGGVIVGGFFEGFAWEEAVGLFA